MTPTRSFEGVRPSDDVRLSFVKLPAALSGKLTLLKLQDVPRLHGNGPQLRLTPVLQRHPSVTSPDVSAPQQVHQSLTAGSLSPQQSFGLAGGQEGA